MIHLYSVLITWMIVMAAAVHASKAHSKNADTNHIHPKMKEKASRTFSPEQGFHDLSLTFGSDRMDTHFDSVNEFNEIVKMHKENSQSRDFYTICADYMDGRKARVVLGKHFGEAFVHTSFISQEKNSACFVVEGDAAQFESFSKGELAFREFTPVPTSLKVHHSAMYHLGLMSSEAKVKALLENGMRSSDKVLMEELSIIVTRGIGMKKQGAEYKQRIESLLQVNPESHLERMSRGFSAESSNPWTSALKEVKAHSKSKVLPMRETCNFKDLKIEYTGNTVVISDIHHIGGSAHPSMCYASLLSVLASQPETLDIRMKGRSKILNNVTKGIIQTGVRQESYPYHDAGINGTNQVVGVGDTGVDDLSCFFVNEDGQQVPRSTYTDPTFDSSFRKVIQYVAYEDGSDNMSGHGTHVSGTVAGSTINSGDADYEYGGNAPGAKIAFFDMSTDGNSVWYPEPMSEYVFPASYEAGARLHSNSWGGPFNFYSNNEIDIDTYLYNTPDFMIFFAASNDGSDGYFSIGNPAVAKNIVTVGASMSSEGDIDSMAYFSSIGPTFDRRIKPDIAAPGYYTTSANASGVGVETCSVITYAGTSMATPATAGTAAVIRQYFEDPRFWQATCNPSYALCAGGAFSPRGATVKAALIHSGEAMHSYNKNQGPTYEPPAALGTPPDYYQGFGRIFLQNVLPLEGVVDFGLYVEEATLTSLQLITYTVTVTDNSLPLRATIAWIDYPNSIVSSKMLLQDIDLTVTSDVTGDVFYGNNIPGDDINNVERVVISQPVIGTYTVKVTAKNFVEAATQPVSIIISALGTVGAPTYTTIPSEDAYNALNCADGQVLVSLDLYDRGGNGWGQGNSYQVLDSKGSVVKSGTMSSNIPYDVYVVDKFCLPTGEYTVELVETGTDTSDMALDVTQCSVHLSQYQLTGKLDLTSDSCNPCDGYRVQLTLLGSYYGVPYGWKEGSHYELKSSNGKVYAQGTLAAGITLLHSICLVEDTYSLSFLGVPATDDFFDDGQPYYANYFGVEEYGMGVGSCTQIVYVDDNLYPYEAVPPGTTATLKVESNQVFFNDYICDVYNEVTHSPTVSPTTPAPTVEVNPSSGGDDNDAKYDTPVIIGFSVGVAVLTIAVIVLIWYICFRKKSDASENLLSANL